MASSLPAGRRWTRRPAGAPYPFPDATFAAVTVADAFHWFDPEPALAEIRRVLRPGGGLALLAVHPDLDPALVRMIEAARGEHPYFDGPGWDEVLAGAPGWSSPRRLTVRSRQTLDLPAYVATFSWVTALRNPEQSAVLQRIREIAGDQPVALDVDTEITLAVRG